MKAWGREVVLEAIGALWALSRVEERQDVKDMFRAMSNNLTKALQEEDDDEVEA